MPKKRLLMMKIREILRLKFDCHLSNRNIAKCLDTSASTVSDVLGRFRQSNFSWPLDTSISDLQLNQVVYPSKKTKSLKVMPDFLHYHFELKRKGMTKLLLWEEYQAQHQDDAFGYTQFCYHYKQWLKLQRRSMRQIHLAGDKLFIDYCGPTLSVINPDTGEIRLAQIFVATLGASSYTYVEAFPSQEKCYWLEAHANAFEHFGGVPHLLVPDNLKSAVTKADRYAPSINSSYQHLADHYGTVVMPARPYKPKDKGKVENAVLLVERWIMMKLRYQEFHTFNELNLTLREHMNALNARKMQGFNTSRAELFQRLDQPALKPLPPTRFTYVEHKRAKVGPDYHIEYQRHYYSVPYTLIGQYVELEVSNRRVKITHQSQVIAQHPRRFTERAMSTVAEHMPTNHQHQKWTPSRLINWGASIGVSTRQLIEHILASKPHPEQAYRRCLGLLGLSKKHGDERLEQACSDALMCRKHQYSFIKNLLENKKEGRLNVEPEPSAEIKHPNLRGPDAYH